MSQEMHAESNKVIARVMAKQTKAEALSTLTKALEQAHEIIKTETGAPRATLLVTRDLKGRRGHFTPFTPWQNGGESFNEIAFNLETFSSAEDLFSTLLHEVAHSLNHANGIEDCSSNQYHNAKFKTQAEALGLKTEKTKKGYSSTSLTEFGAKRWAKALKIVATAYDLTALGGESAKPKGRNTNLIKAECTDCGNVIRLSRTVIESGVMCMPCETQFTEA